MRDFSKNRDYNSVNVEGAVFSHTLQAKTSGPNSKNPGTEFITGSLNIATDADSLNVVPVNFGYVTRYYKKPDANGNPRENDTYKLLKQIIDTNPTVEAKGRDNAMIVRAQGDIEINDFVARNGDMVAQQRVRGSFLHEGARSNGSASFDVDMLITQYTERETDSERYGTIRGYIFNYRSDFLPVSFNVRIVDGMGYFDSMDINSNNPLLTHVWGDINTSTVEVEAGGDAAFGAVRTTSRSFRSWDIAGAAGVPYEFGDDDVMTMDDIKIGMANREEHLAAVRADHENRQRENNNGGNSFTAETPASSSGFKF